MIIEATNPEKCTDCGKIEELRPYGVNGAWVCFSCGMKDEVNARKQFKKILDGSENKAGHA